MSIEVKVPPLPESVTDATLISWHKKNGEAVDRDENLVDLETDKVVLEVPAPTAGVLKEIKIPDGETVTSGQVLAILEPGAAPSESAKPPADSAASPSPEAAESQAKPAPTEPNPAVAQGSGSAAESAVSHDTTGRVGPAVRRLAEEHGVDATAVPGTGRDGRVTKADVLDYLAEGDAEDLGPEEQVSASQQAGSRQERRVPMTRLRRRIAERLVGAQQTAAMLTTFNDVDMSAIMALRKRYRDNFQKNHDIKLGFMSFFVRASIEALRQFPLVNASIDGDDIIYHEFFDIGVAVSSNRGLVVPVLRNAEDLSFAGIEKAIADLATRAGSGTLGIDELTGGTFTVTNGGIFGSLNSTPILNPPQSGILGMHKIQERPVVVDGQIVVRPMMNLALSYDHRIVDGREAVQCLVAIKDGLEDPARLLLQV